MCNPPPPPLSCDNVLQHFDRTNILAKSVLPCSKQNIVSKKSATLVAYILSSAFPKTGGKEIMRKNLDRCVRA